MSALDAIDNERKKDPYAKLQEMGYVPGIGFAKNQGSALPADAPTSKTQANTSNNSTVANSNDVLNNNQAVSGAEAGLAGATGLRQAQSAGNSFGGGSQQDSNSSSHRESTQFSAIAQAKESSQMRAAVQVSFGDISPEDRQLTQLRARVADQYRQRFGVELGDDVKAVLNNMTEPADLEQALRVMATQKRSDLPAPELNAFEQALQHVHQDFFTPISDEIHQRQQQ